MTRRHLFALIAAAFSGKLAHPRPKTGGLFNPKSDIAQQYKSAVLRSGWADLSSPLMPGDIITIVDPDGSVRTIEINKAHDGRIGQSHFPRIAVMPWSPKDAPSHTKKANTPAKEKQWSEVANSELKRTEDEARAVRAANAVVKKHPAKHWSGK